MRKPPPPHVAKIEDYTGQNFDQVDLNQSLITTKIKMILKTIILILKKKKKIESKVPETTITLLESLEHIQTL